MKTIFTKSTLFCFACLYASVTLSQSLPPGQAAKFGIDGDIRTDQADQGNFTVAGSHDWFKKAGGTGVGLLDTNGNGLYTSEIKSGKNIAFNKKMQFPRYSVQDGILMLDAGYARDYYGIGPADILNDKTVFISSAKESNKNFQNPATWTTIPTGGTIPNKTDIIDSYVNMRRNGTAVSGNKVSDLVLTVGATTLSTDGDHYVDFEFYKDRITYNPSTGKFETPAPAATGGHSAWIVRPNGDIDKFGDLTISYTFNNGGVKDIQIFIWTDYKTYMRSSTNRFDFVKDSWMGASTRDGYGYAQIMPNGNYSLKAWGTVNVNQTAGPVWGTSSKDLGTQSGNFAAEGYSTGQFAEAGINLTTFGIDPASTDLGMAACDPPFTRFMVKTRSSSAFNASLQDFTGPYEFLDAPMPIAKLNQPATLTCGLTSQTLTPANYTDGSYYSWSTANGRIIGSNTDSSLVQVDRAGTYYLKAAVVQGCETATDSIVVQQDILKPKATAGISTSIIFPGTTATLLGGDPIQSNYSTPFGSSAGLSWQWTGPSGFASTQQNPMTTTPGTYTLTVTELRNGCTDVAYTVLGVGSTLPVKFLDFSVNADKQQKLNRLAWKMGNVAEAEKFVVEKSSNGVDFAPASYVFADAAFTSYSAKDYTGEKVTYYRIKTLAKSGETVLSSVVKAEGHASDNAFTAFTDAGGIITLNYSADVSETLNIRVLNLNGQVLKAVSRNVVAGSNLLKLTEFTKPAEGMYLVHVQGQHTTLSAKLKW
jgi:hypothetical protein